MRESFIFYKSFYESIKELPDSNKIEIYEAIFEKEFHDVDTELKGISKSIYTLILPQLEANNKRYENGKKGGRPKLENQNKTKIKPNNNQKETKVKPNNNVNVNVNENVNVNDNDNIYEFVEKNFGRILSPLEYELIGTWEDNELTRYAIKQTVLNRATSLKYTEKILSSYKSKGIKTVLEAQQDDNKRNKEVVPKWFDKKIEQEELTNEEQKEIDELLKEFN